MIFFIFFAVVTIGSPSRICAEDDLKEPKELRIGVSEFRTYVESPTLKQLGQTVARMFLEKLQALNKKRIHPAEREGFIRVLVKKSRIEELKKLDEIYRKRDQLALSSLKEKGKSTYIELTTRIHESLQKIRYLESLDPKEVMLEKEGKPLKWVETNLKGELLAPVRSTFKEACREAHIDYLITGEVEEIFQDVVSVRVILYSDIEGKVLYEKETMGTTREPLVDQLIPDLVTHLLGAEYGSLEITVQPKDAGIFLNGELVGIGKVSKPFLPTGEYRIEINRPGYQFLAQEILLTSQELRKIEVTLQALSLEPFQIASLPSPANLYVGAERKGATPLSLDEASTDSIGRVEKEGYKAFVFPLERQPQDQQVILPKDLFPWKERIERKREDFYRAFGWFVLSLPLPFLLYGYYENESFRSIQYSKSSRHDPTEAGKLTDRMNGIYYGYLGSLFLSSSLLVNALTTLMDYLRTGEASVKYPDQKP